ncbi:MAG: AraC family transcriptional regulator [Myxococcaceae bacterium]|nr:AraC family transcriptional regulator [Myxococcaceae bacterium]
MATSVLFASGLMAELERLDVDPRSLLKACEVDGQRLHELRGKLSLEEVDALARAALELTGEPGLGLTLGAQAPFTTLRLLGHLLFAQQTLRDAFRVLRRYATLLVDGPYWDLIECGSVATFTYEAQVQLGDSTRLATDFVLSMAARVITYFAAGKPELSRVAVRHARPDYTERYQQVFSCPVLFEQETNSLAFARSVLDRKQPHSDDSLAKLLSESADRLLSERSMAQSFAQRVRTWLSYERELKDVDLQRAARRFGLSARSLRRNLRTEGTSLSHLLDEARHALACRELSRPDSSIKEAAQRVGFSEQSGFHRAFRRWTGMTPLQFLRGERVRPVPSRTEPPVALRSDEGTRRRLTA